MDSKKGILILTGTYPPEIGGPASYAPAIGKFFSERFKVTILALSSVWNTKEDKNMPFKTIRIWKGNPWILRNTLFFIRSLLQVRKHDLVYVLSTLHGGITGVIAARIFKKKLFIRIPGDYAWQNAMISGKTNLSIDEFQKSKKSGWIKTLYQLQSWICRNSNAVIVPSEYLASLVKGWNVPPEKIKVVYNGTDFLPSSLSREEARKKIGIAGNILLSAGRLASWKGFRMLIKIMPRLLEINQFFRLIILGDGPDRGILEAMVKNLGLSKKVYLLGKKSREDLAVYMAASDLFVLNSGYEGFSHQILEAMAQGVPVVTSSSGGNKEIIHQGENGFMVKYNDEFNLIEAIKAVYKNEELKEHFIKEGKKTADHFSLDRMYQETLALVKEYV